MRIAITGYSRGVGRALALGFAGRGDELLLLGRKSDSAAQTLELLREQAPQASIETVEVDLADSKDVERSAALIRQLPAVDVLIHNAGVIERAAVEEMSFESFDRQLQVNLSSPARLTSAFLPAMKARKQGRILFVSSISAVVGTRRQSAYHAAKAGLVGFMRCLAEELSDTGLLTMALLPGSIDTEMLAGSGFPPRMTAEDIFTTLLFYATEAPLAHNGAAVEIFGV